MENEDLIREQMAETRTSLTEKLETLESQVSSTVQGASANVADTVEAVKETVESVKDTVQETVATVKESVAETIDSVKDSVQDGLDAVKSLFDVPALVDAHPWVMVAGSVALGFLAAEIVASAGGESGETPTDYTEPLPPDHISGEDRFERERPASMFAGVFKAFEPEIKRLQSVAVGSLMSFVRAKIASNVPAHMAHYLTEVVDSVTRKMGGQLMDEQEDSEHEPHHGNGRHARAAQEA